MRDKVYLVTGGAGGIGSAVVRVVAKNAERGILIIHYNSNNVGAENLKKEIEKENKNIKVFILQADLERKEECEKLCNLILKKFGTVDVLVNNAGYVEDKELSKRTYEDFEKTIKINLISNFYLSKILGYKMFEQKSGKIVNISSTSGLILHSGSMNPTSIDYDASKAGINALTKNFAQEFAPYVNVNAVAPGWVDTPLNYELPECVRQNENEKILKNRWASAEEVAELVWYLISDKADFINGSIYEIDGGRR